MKSWFNEFKRGRRSLKDEVREGRPKTAVLSENIDVVREVVMQDHHVTYREIEAFLGISATSIHSILHEHLAVKNICFRFRIIHVANTTDEFLTISNQNQATIIVITFIFCFVLCDFDEERSTLPMLFKMHSLKQG